MSKCHIVGNHMPRLKYLCEERESEMPLSSEFFHYVIRGQGYLYLYVGPSILTITHLLVNWLYLSVSFIKVLSFLLS